MRQPPLSRAPWWALVVLALVLAPRRAAAHQTAIKYVDVTVEPDDPSAVTIHLTAAPSDVAEALGLPADATPPLAQVLAAETTLDPHLARWVVVGDGACRPGAVLVRAAKDPTLFAATWTVGCPHPLDPTGIDVAGLIALDPRQSVVVHATAPGMPDVDTILDRSTTRLALPLRGNGPSTFTAWLRAGMNHIYDGYDHIAFVLLLVLIVGLERRPAPGPVRWDLRSLGQTLRRTAGVVTAFTIAHCLTLIATSLGWVALPSRLVESLIAASIIYTAIEDIVHPDVRWRFWLAFGFGLVHGMGFASVLADLLPAHAVLKPLLIFNLGIEVGQLTIIAVAVPTLLVLARAIGADRYRRIALPTLAGALGLLGALWLIERVVGVTILGF